MALDIYLFMRRYLSGFLRCNAFRCLYSPCMCDCEDRDYFINFLLFCFLCFFSALHYFIFFRNRIEKHTPKISCISEYCSSICLWCWKIFSVFKNKIKFLLDSPLLSRIFLYILPFSKKFVAFTFKFSRASFFKILWEYSNRMSAQYTHMRMLHARNCGFNNVYCVHMHAISLELFI